MGRLNLLGGQINLLGGQMPIQLTCYLQEGVNILFRSAKLAYLLEIDTPPEGYVS